MLDLGESICLFTLPLLHFHLCRAAQEKFYYDSCFNKSQDTWQAHAHMHINLELRWKKDKVLVVVATLTSGCQEFKREQGVQILRGRVLEIARSQPSCNFAKGSLGEEVERKNKKGKCGFREWDAWNEYNNFVNSGLYLSLIVQDFLRSKTYFKDSPKLKMLKKAAVKDIS